MDIFLPEQRSNIMRKVKSSGSTHEKLIGNILSSLNLPFQTNVPGLPGKPDFIISHVKWAIFVNGCFWHGHKGCKRSELPQTNTAFWQNKISSNIKRDRKVRSELKKSGWHVTTLWSCRLSKKNFEKISITILKKFKLLEENVKQIRFRSSPFPVQRHKTGVVIKGLAAERTIKKMKTPIQKIKQEE
jgi:DNA mismatch endonuclease, patch repair protein